MGKVSFGSHHQRDWEEFLELRLPEWTGTGVQKFSKNRCSEQDF